MKKLPSAWQFFHTKIKKTSRRGQIMKLNIQVMKTEKSLEKMFSVELTGDRNKDLASFEALSIELYIWISEEGFFEKPK